MKAATFICIFLSLSLALAAPLEIVVATESLCPDCRDFIVNAYAKAIKTEGIEKLANIVIVPFGNAHETQNGDQWDFTCQHGAKECLGNAIENCLIEHFDKEVYQRVLVCLESRIFGGAEWANVVSACGKQENADLSGLIPCANSQEGNELTHKAAQNTDPKHNYVPWVAVNGVHDTDVENAVLDDLVKYACKQYNGDEKIPACENHKLIAQSDEDPLQITILTESLCPYCHDFIIEPFADALQVKDLEKIANITIIPFGNAKEIQNGDRFEFTCQHGEEECVGNAIENCAIARFDKPTAGRLLVCLATKIFEDNATWKTVVPACGEQENVDLSDILECASGLEGEQLTHIAAQNTDPAHQFVPWVTINGVYTPKAQNRIINDSIVKYACDNYKGSVKIAACQTAEMRSLSGKRSWRE